MSDHPLRYALANELHARPFPPMTAPGQVAYLAIKEPEGGAKRDRSRDLDHLRALLDRYGAPHPQPEATHYFGEIGKYALKWEQHTEFVTYTLFSTGTTEQPFDSALWEVFSPDWLATMPGSRITSAHIHVAEMPQDMAAIRAKLDDWFVPESLAASQVIDDTAVIAGDFRIAPTGHMHFAVFARPDTGKRRLGRIVQRICEIETYKAMAMLGLPRAREISVRLSDIDARLSMLSAEMTGEIARPEASLQTLLTSAAELENLMAQSAFRFAATKAYEAIVNQRIEVLTEARFNGRQSFAEFMMRRFDPAIRTVEATELRMQSMIERAARAGDLLRTRVDVDRQQQNQALLESMDKRADLQLRLQKTVEGLSVVAISYYAVNLAVYLTAPFAEQVGVTDSLLTALVALPVVLGVWLVVRRIRQSME
ncbi:MAG: DUF3422 domain-containing protein [Pseudomonadota bacterium]